MKMKGTTIIAVKHKGQSAMAGDGQVTLGQNTIMKHGAKKIRCIYNNTVLVGFAGSVADAFALFEKFEGKLEQYNGNLKRAAVELAKEWRMDKVLRTLEALLVAMDKECLLIISGNGEVIEPDDNIAAIGSGGPYALAAARAFVKASNLNAKQSGKFIKDSSINMCIYK